MNKLEYIILRVVLFCIILKKDSLLVRHKMIIFSCSRFTFQLLSLPVPFTRLNKDESIYFINEYEKLRPCLVLGYVFKTAKILLFFLIVSPWIWTWSIIYIDLYSCQSTRISRGASSAAIAFYHEMWVFIRRIG